MKKRLDESHFQDAISGLEVGPQTIAIARGVLVEGRTQATFVKELQISKGAVSQAVNRVWISYLEKHLPRGYERVTVVLPEHQAFIVKRWGKDAAKKLQESE